jgi:hypothetical protein
LPRACRIVRSLLGKVAAITLLGWLLLALGALPGILHQALTPDAVVASPSIMAGMVFGVNVPAILLIVLVGVLIALYTSSPRFALLLTIAFAGFLVLVATALVVGWSNQSSVVIAGSAAQITAGAVSIVLVDGVLLGWLLMTVQRDRLLAIG